MPAVPALLVNPNVPCPTGEVYDRFDEQAGGEGFAQLKFPKFKNAKHFVDWLGANTRNDLEAAAISLVPDISTVLKALGALEGAKLTRMSGSGATCFALFNTLEAARAAEAKIADEHSGWWAKATMLGGVA